MRITPIFPLYRPMPLKNVDFVSYLKLYFHEGPKKGIFDFVHAACNSRSEVSEVKSYKSIY